jgi:hypothetical protein
MGCGCKKKVIIPPQPAQPAPPVPAPAKVVLRESVPPPVHPPKPLEPPQNEVNRIVEKLNSITNQVLI